MAANTTAADTIVLVHGFWVTPRTGSRPGSPSAIRFVEPVMSPSSNGRVHGGFVPSAPVASGAALVLRVLSRLPNP
jgi:hypothetical protein